MTILNVLWLVLSKKNYDMADILDATDIYKEIFGSNHLEHNMDLLHKKYEDTDYDKNAINLFLVYFEDILDEIKKTSVEEARVKIKSEQNPWINMG